MRGFENLQAHALTQSGEAVAAAMLPGAVKLRNFVLAGLVATAIAAAPHPAEAGWLGEAVGAGAGAAVMSGVGKGDGRVAAMVVGGVMGKEIGGAVTESPSAPNYGTPSYGTPQPQGNTLDVGRTATKGVGAAIGAGLGSLIGKGNGRIAAMVLGGVLGAEAADRVAYGQGQQPGASAVTPSGFRNGSIPLTENERASFDKAAAETEQTFDSFRNARAYVESVQYRYDFSTGHDRDQLGSDLSRARYGAEGARRQFESTRGQFAGLVSDAAARYNRDVSQYANMAYTWAAVPTEGGVSVATLNQVAERIPSKAPAQRYGM